ncbi:MAG: recombination protein RecR [Treponema sp.]|nr:recombination protein RecR [Treponema sp.]
MNIIDELTASFSRLPGIGKKSAARIVNHLLKADPAYMHAFSRQIAELQEKIKPCSICGSWTEKDPCPICSNPVRDRSIICVVEQPQDVQTIEAAGGYTGLYHVLGGVIAPLEGIGPDQLNIASLIMRAKDEEISEIIIATNPTFEGDSTALYLQRLLAEHTNVKVTRLATGIPVGGDLEYADKLTLARSFRGRTAI